MSSERNNTNWKITLWSVKEYSGLDRTLRVSRVFSAAKPALSLIHYCLYWRCYCVLSYNQLRPLYAAETVARALGSTSITGWRSKHDTRVVDSANGSPWVAAKMLLKCCLYHIIALYIAVNAVTYPTFNAGGRTSQGWPFQGGVGVSPLGRARKTLYDIRSRERKGYQQGR